MYCCENKSQELSCSRPPRSARQSASLHRTGPPAMFSPRAGGLQVHPPLALRRLRPPMVCCGKNYQKRSPHARTSTKDARLFRRCNLLRLSLKHSCLTPYFSSSWIPRKYQCHSLIAPAIYLLYENFAHLAEYRLSHGGVAPGEPYSAATFCFAPAVCSTRKYRRQW